VTLALPGLDALPPPALRQLALSQWDTPPELAARVVGLASKLLDDCTNRAIPCRILEPSAGVGRLLAPLRARCPGAIITAHEIDPVRVRHLEMLRLADQVREGDFLGAPRPARPYDLAVLNPPYEAGLDGRFVARCMEVATQVIAILRTNALHGAERFDRVWSEVADGPWQLRALRYCIGRPRFDGADGSPMSDFIAVHLVRDGFGATDVGWW
jgi:predicted RNA methylase